MTSSSEPRAVRADAAATVTTMHTPDLRQGAWTRLGGRTVLGDGPAESVFDELAEKAWTAARSQGYAIGWSEGRRKAQAAAALSETAAASARAEADARFRAEHDEALAGLREATARMLALADATCTALEEQASELALALTEELVGHELRHESDADVVRRVVRALPRDLADSKDIVTVRLHPSLVATASGGQLSDVGLRLVADAGLSRADAVVELSDHALSLDIDGALARLREVLG